MLRVRTIYASTAASAARYYAGPDRGYAGYVDPEGTQEAPGYWGGRQAADLGLTGPVAAADLEALLSGHDPKTGATLGAPFVDRFTKHGTLIQAVAGYDATFSAPKSVSVWWGLTGDQGVLDAHDSAVAAVLGHLERYGCTTRVRVDGTRSYPDVNRLTMAVFQQSTSRDDDPQLHTHAVISSRSRPRTAGGTRSTPTTSSTTSTPSATSTSRCCAPSSPTATASPGARSVTCSGRRRASDSAIWPPAAFAILSDRGRASGTDGVARLCRARS